jgi:hypothetical protein
LPEAGIPPGYLMCPCGGRRKLVAAVQDKGEIERFPSACLRTGLKHLAPWAVPEPVLSEAEGPWRSGVRPKSCTRPSRSLRTRGTAGSRCRTSGRHRSGAVRGARGAR